MATVEYSSNNSGGSWWLSDEDWFGLEAAGWAVDWIKDAPFHNGNERFLGALATSATREGLSEEEAISEFQRITGEYASDVGCDCCGPPHYFSEV